MIRSSVGRCGRTGRGAATLLLVGCLLAAPAALADAVFPQPAEIDVQVEFWIAVFSEWRLDQIVVHDIDYPDVVYEVIALPGRTEFPYTEEQQELVDDLREKWIGLLEGAGERLRAGRALTSEQQTWVERLRAAGGDDALRDAHERVRTQRGLRERFKRGIEISGRYITTFREIFRSRNLPEDLAYLPHVESSFQTSARSSAGATGIWQFTRGTGRQFMRITSSYDERLDPVAATRAAADYFRIAYDKLGDWPLAVTSYNHGVHGMGRAKEQFGTDFVRIQREYRSRSFGFASKNFYAEFLAARAVVGDAERYFPEGLTFETPADVESIVYSRRGTAARVAAEFGVPLAEMAALNPAWTVRALRDGRALPSGITVWIPRGTAQAYRPGPGGVHIVSKGETLSDIAASYRVSVAALQRWNGMNPGDDLIHPGQQLVLEAGDPVVEHVVRSGETLSGIAQQYGTTVADLRRLNSMESKQSLIHAGQELQVELGDDVTHVVRRGDTLTEIAEDYGVPLSELLAANGLRLRTVIHPGQRLTVPLAN